MSMKTVVGSVSFTETEMQQVRTAAAAGRDTLIETLVGMEKNAGLDYSGWTQLLDTLLSMDHSLARAAA